MPLAGSTDDASTSKENGLLPLTASPAHVISSPIGLLSPPPSSTSISPPGAKGNSLATPPATTSPSQQLQSPRRSSSSPRSSPPISQKRSLSSGSPHRVGPSVSPRRSPAHAPAKGRSLSNPPEPVSVSMPHTGEGGVGVRGGRPPPLKPVMDGYSAHSLVSIGCCCQYCMCVYYNRAYYIIQPLRTCAMSHVCVVYILWCVLFGVSVLLTSPLRRRGYSTHSVCLSVCLLPL